MKDVIRGELRVAAETGYTEGPFVEDGAAPPMLEIARVVMAASAGKSFHMSVSQEPSIAWRILHELLEEQFLALRAT